MQLPTPDQQECLDVLRLLVQVKSYSQTSGEIDATNDMAEVMRRAGLESATHSFDGGKRQNAVGVWRGVGGGKTLLFNGHLDTNPVTEGWTVDPWGGLGDVVLTYVVGELQGGVGTVALIEQGLCKADYFVNCEPSDLKAITMHAESLVFRIELTGVTRHMSKREDATDAIMATTDLVPRLNSLVFDNASSPDVAACNRCSVGVVRAGLGREMADWRPPQVADFAVIRGSARFGPGQTHADVRSALEAACEETKSRYPELQYAVHFENAVTMPAFQVEKDAYIVKRLNEAYQAVRPGMTQPTGALAPQCFYGSDAGHLYKTLGMQGVVCGPGGKYNTMPDERVEVSDYMDCIKMFIRLIVDVCA